ncbi:hypothetical protein [Rhizobium sp. PAMB 3182]
MTLQLVEWMEKLADARGEVAIADVLRRMPYTQMLKYQDSIVRRCTMNAFPEGETYIRLVCTMLRTERGSERFRELVPMVATVSRRMDEVAGHAPVPRPAPPEPEPSPELPPVPDHSKTEL